MSEELFLFIDGCDHAYGQGDLQLRIEDDGGIYITISGEDGHASIDKNAAQRLRDWLTQYIEGSN